MEGRQSAVPVQLAVVVALLVVGHIGRRLRSGKLPPTVSLRNSATSVSMNTPSAPAGYIRVYYVYMLFLF